MRGVDRNRAQETTASRLTIGVDRDHGTPLWPLPPVPAAFDLNGPPTEVHWHFFQMSVANIVVILLMIASFVAAVPLPLPHRGRQP